MYTSGITKAVRLALLMVAPGNTDRMRQLVDRWRVLRQVLAQAKKSGTRLTNDRGANQAARARLKACARDGYSPGTFNPGATADWSGRLNLAGTLIETIHLYLTLLHGRDRI